MQFYCKTLMDSLNIFSFWKTCYIMFSTGTRLLTIYMLLCSSLLLSKSFISLDSTLIEIIFLVSTCKNIFQFQHVEIIFLVSTCKNICLVSTCRNYIFSFNMQKLYFQFQPVKLYFQFQPVKLYFQFQTVEITIYNPTG